MQTAVITPPAARPALLALAAAVLAAGCGPAGRGGSGAAISAAGAMVAARVPTPFVEEATVSLALDRIDQRSLPLDRTYRHFGTGRGVTVYVFDGGVLDSHPELAGRVRRGFDAFPDEERVCNAHGTAVAGAAAGTTLGVAPDAEVVDVKMVQCRYMRGTVDAIVRGTRWVLEDHLRHPGRRAIANWSFIADTVHAIPALDSAVRRLNDAGIPVVVAAGNMEIDACQVSPANAPGAIAVGASRLRRGRDSAGTLVDARARGTAYGPCLDVFAPGDSVLLPSIDADRRPTSQLWNGTSMAAGYVSGAIALYLEAHPFATTAAASDHIRDNAAGRVDAAQSPGAGMLYVGAGAPAQLVAGRPPVRPAPATAIAGYARR